MKETPDDKVMAAVIAALPGRHLEIWAKVRASIPDVHPAQVWRALASGSMKLDENTSVWSRSA